MLNPKWACLCAALSTAALFSQVAATQSNTTPSTVAYVYVSSAPTNANVGQIIGYAAAPNGKLTPITGSPFNGNVDSMAVNGRYLFGSDQDGLNVDTYTIGSDGSLQIVDQTDLAKTTPNDCGIAGDLILDHTGQSLYNMTYRADCANNAYSSFAVTKGSGTLNYLGASEYANWLSLPPTFTGNDKYAYSVSCIENMFWSVFGLSRSSNGMLQPISGFNYSLPADRPNDFWCPTRAISDPTNHIAMALQPINNTEFMPDGGAQIASFTSAANGNLSTTNTAATMPVAQVGTVQAMRMNYGGKMLAVAGTNGVQIFHWRGALAPTHYTDLLIKDNISQIFWDKYNHLYAVSATSGKLYVYSISPTAHSQAPGSPYGIPAPRNLIVQPWPLPWD